MSTICKVAAIVGACATLAACELPPPEVIQRGYRGTSMGLVYNKDAVEALQVANQLPAAQPVLPGYEGEPLASQVYQNVQVLGGLTVGEFTRVMLAITQWVAPPDQSCSYCHGDNQADDSKYQKRVARSMLQMTLDVNANWKAHVKETGVVCWTCHRGQPVPQQVWFKPAPPDERGYAASVAGQNLAAPSVGLSSLPGDPFTPFLLEASNIRVYSTTALPAGSRTSIKQTEWTYGLMMHSSQALGVNCTYCHNSQAFGSWAASPPQRTTAWYGIRMARELNNKYMVPLTGEFPAHRLGPTGDVAKINCATCHQGVYKPMFGQSIARDYPQLQAPRPQPPKPGETGPDGLPVDGMAPTGPAPAAVAPAAATPTPAAAGRPTIAAAAAGVPASY